MPRQSPCPENKAEGRGFAPACSTHVAPRLRRCEHGAPVQGAGFVDLTARWFKYWLLVPSTLSRLVYKPCSWTGAPCSHRRSRGATWVEHAGAKPLPSAFYSLRRSATGNVAKTSLNRRPSSVTVNVSPVKTLRYVFPGSTASRSLPHASRNGSCSFPFMSV